MSRANPNVKEFVKYLDYTVKVFDKHVAEEDFENKDSDVYKLFDTLFHMYDNILDDQTSDLPRIRSRASTEETDYPKWENQSTQNRYQKSTTSETPVKQRKRHQKQITQTTESESSFWETPVKKSSVKKSSPKKYTSDSETSIPGISVNINRHNYSSEYNDEINSKIFAIKKMLDKKQKIDK
jgi:hypothetical protein